MCYVTKRLLAHSEPQLQSHKVLTRRPDRGDVTWRRQQDTQPPAGALATFNKLCRQELLGAGEAGSGQVFNVVCRSTSAGVMRRQEQLTTLRGTGRGTPIGAAA